MSYKPVSGIVPQYSNDSNELASGYYLKFYIANTTTPLSMATDAAGGTLLVKCKLNPDGIPISNPLDNDTVFIPHVDQAYRLVIYRNEADADANATASAFLNVPDIKPLIGTDNQTAEDVSYDNATSGLAATTAQAAIDEIDTTLDTRGTSFTANVTTSPTDTTSGRVWRTDDLVKTTSPTDTTSERVWRTDDLVKTASTSDQTTGRITKNGDNPLYGSIYFGSAVAANQLDDYEEGTFTPLAIGTSAAGTGTYTDQSGRYVKIGKAVHFSININWTAHTGTGNLKISGLPFTTVNESASNHSVFAYHSELALSASNVLVPFLDVNATTITLRQVSTGGGVATDVPMDTAVSYIMLTGWYESA